jgi:hypothetical protein
MGRPWRRCRPRSRRWRTRCAASTTRTRHAGRWDAADSKTILVRDTRPIVLAVFGAVGLVLSHRLRQMSPICSSRAPAIVDGSSRCAAAVGAAAPGRLRRQLPHRDRGARTAWRRGRHPGGGGRRACAGLRHRSDVSSRRCATPGHLRARFRAGGVERQQSAVRIDSRLAAVAPRRAFDPDRGVTRRQPKAHRSLAGRRGTGARILPFSSVPDC